MANKRKFAVCTDSACDIPFDMAEQTGVDILSFQISMDGNSYTERVDFDFDQYYDMLRTCEGMPSTAHITMPRFIEQFEKYEAAGITEVLYVSICGKGSATLDAAIMAKEAFLREHPDTPMQIYLVDSRTYSMTYGWFVAEAARKLHNGAEMLAIVEWLEDVFSRMEVMLAAFSLRFMKKSGRISAAAAFAGELLGLRPLISLVDGVSTVRKKVRGDKDVLPAMMEYVEKNMDDTTTYMVGGTNQQVVEELAAMCKKKWKVEPLCQFKLGAAVATNTGPDAVAIVFMGEKRPG